MRILILGGSGLISTGITRLLTARGDEVVLLNRGITPDPVDGVRRITGDRNDLGDLGAALDAGPFDAVIDMICFTPAQADVAIRAFAGRVRQYVLCSTVDVYTKSAGNYPLVEGAERKPSPTFAYAYDKAICEQRFEAAAAEGAFELTILRPGATYVDGAVAPMGSYQLYVERLRAGLPIVLHGDGTAIWVAAHRDDVAVAFVNALGNEAAYDRAYHVTGSELLTWNRYWATVADALAVECRVVHIPTDVLQRLSPRGSEWCVENFQHDNIFDNAAARRDLGFEYRVDWATGTRRFGFDFPVPVDPAVRSDFEAMLDAWQSGVALAERRVRGLEL